MAKKQERHRGKSPSPFAKNWQNWMQDSTRYQHDDTRPDEIKQRDDIGSHYERRKKRINNPIRSIVF